MSLPRLYPSILCHISFQQSVDFLGSPSAIAIKSALGWVLWVKNSKSARFPIVIVTMLVNQFEISSPYVTCCCRFFTITSWFPRTTCKKSPVSFAVKFFAWFTRSLISSRSFRLRVLHETPWCLYPPPSDYWGFSWRLQPSFHCQVLPWLVATWLRYPFGWFNFIP